MAEAAVPALDAEPHRLPIAQLDALRCVVGAREPVTTDDVATMLGLSRKHVQDQLLQLYRSGHLERRAEVTSAGGWRYVYAPELPDTPADGSGAQDNEHTGGFSIRVRAAIDRLLASGQNYAKAPDVARAMGKEPSRGLNVAIGHGLGSLAESETPVVEYWSPGNGTTVWRLIPEEERSSVEERDER